MKPLTEEGVIAMAGFGAALMAYAAVRGASDTIENVRGKVGNSVGSFGEALGLPDFGISELIGGDE